MSNSRDYNQELKDTADHRYAYGFDFDVMHPYMLQSFAPFFREGNALELGSFKGDFTSALPPISPTSHASRHPMKPWRWQDVRWAAG